MRVGSDIGALCRKCGDVWHVVVAILNGKIVKVECKQCGARHAYRAADGTANGGRRALARTSGAGAGGSKTSKTSTPSRSQPTLVVEADLSRPVRSYRPSERYEMGDRVTHPSFGEGVVQAIAGPTKVHVLFAGGAKTLVHARETG